MPQGFFIILAKEKEDLLYLHTVIVSNAPVRMTKRNYFFALEQISVSLVMT